MKIEDKKMKLMECLMLLTKRDRLRINLILAMLFVSSNINAQTVTNGAFTSASLGWGCSPETSPESLYGGTGSNIVAEVDTCLLYTSPSPRDRQKSRMPSSA